MRFLRLSGDGFTRSLERLGSGLRINRAADDAAGLSISEKLKAQARGAAQAARNAQDGISVIQTADGALVELHEILQRMRELAVQAANDTLTTDDRAAIQSEIDSLRSEIDAISKQTTFNTRKLLDGSLSTSPPAVPTLLDPTSELQPGANDGNVLVTALDVSNATAGRTYSFTYSPNDTPTLDSAASTYFSTPPQTIGVATIWDISITAGQPSIGTYTFLGGTTLRKDSTGEVVSIDHWNHTPITSGSHAGETHAQAVFQQFAAGEQLGFNFFDTRTSLTSSSPHPDEEALMAAGRTIMYSDQATTGTLTLTRSGGGTAAAAAPNVAAPGTSTSLTFNFGDGTSVVLTSQSQVANLTGDQLGSFLTNPANDTFKTSPLPQTPGLTLQIGPNRSDSFLFTIDAVSSTRLGADSVSLSALDLTSGSGASLAIGTLDAAITSLSITRAGLGASQNRLEHIIRGLHIYEENVTVANSRIRDADMAHENVALARSRILQEAGLALLAQANVQPRLVLQILGA